MHHSGYTMIHVPLARAARSAPIYRQIYERIRQAILTGSLPPGARLPSKRSLFDKIGV